MDVRDDTTARDGRLDERVELLVSADGELQVARSDTLHLEVLRRVASKLEHLGREVLEDSCGVHSARSADAATRDDAVFEHTVNTADGELSRVHVVFVFLKI